MISHVTLEKGPKSYSKVFTYQSCFLSDQNWTNIFLYPTVFYLSFHCCRYWSQILWSQFFFLKFNRINALKLITNNFFLKLNIVNASKLIRSLVRGPLFRNFILFLALYFIKEFYDPNYLYRFIFCNLESAYIHVTMAGTTLPSINAKPPLHFILNLNERNAWPSLHSNSTMWCCLLSTISLSFLLKVNIKICFKKKNTNKNSKVKK